MSKKSIIWIIALIILAIIALTIINNIINNNEEKETFIATVLENQSTSLLVEPVEGEDELRSSDKIVVRLRKDVGTIENVSEFIVGSKVEITYDGMIMESYPAQINASEIRLVN